MSIRELLKSAGSLTRLIAGCLRIEEGRELERGVCDIRTFGSRHSSSVNFCGGQGVVTAPSLASPNTKAFHLAQFESAMRKGCVTAPEAPTPITMTR